MSRNLGKEPASGTQDLGRSLDEGRGALEMLENVPEHDCVERVAAEVEGGEVALDRIESALDASTNRSLADVDPGRAKAASSGHIEDGSVATANVEDPGAFRQLRRELVSEETSGTLFEHRVTGEAGVVVLVRGIGVEPEGGGESMPTSAAARQRHAARTAYPAR